MHVNMEAYSPLSQGSTNTRSVIRGSPFILPQRRRAQQNILTKSTTTTMENNSRMHRMTEVSRPREDSARAGTRKHTFPARPLISAHQTPLNCFPLPTCLSNIQTFDLLQIAHLQAQEHLRSARAPLGDRLARVLSIPFSGQARRTVCVRRRFMRMSTSTERLRATGPWAVDREVLAESVGLRR